VSSFVPAELETAQVRSWSCLRHWGHQALLWPSQIKACRGPTVAGLGRRLEDKDCKGHGAELLEKEGRSGNMARAASCAAAATGEACQIKLLGGILMNISLVLGYILLHHCG